MRPRSTPARRQGPPRAVAAATGSRRRHAPPRRRRCSGRPPGQPFRGAPVGSVQAPRSRRTDRRAASAVHRPRAPRLRVPSWDRNARIPMGSAPLKTKSSPGVTRSPPRNGASTTEAPSMNPVPSLFRTVDTDDRGSALNARPDGRGHPHRPRSTSRTVTRFTKGNGYAIRSRSGRAGSLVGTRGPAAPSRVEPAVRRRHRSRASDRPGVNPSVEALPRFCGAGRDGVGRVRRPAPRAPRTWPPPGSGADGPGRGRTPRRSCRRPRCPKGGPRTRRWRWRP